MDGLREIKKHIGWDVERMRDKHLEKNSGYIGIIGRESGGI